MGIEIGSRGEAVTDDANKTSGANEASTEDNILAVDLRVGKRAGCSQNDDLLSGGGGLGRGVPQLL